MLDDAKLASYNVITLTPNTDYTTKISFLLPGYVLLHYRALTTENYKTYTQAHLAEAWVR